MTDDTAARLALSVAITELESLAYLASDSTDWRTLLEIKLRARSTATELRKQMAEIDALPTAEDVAEITARVEQPAGFLRDWSPR